MQNINQEAGLPANNLSQKLFYLQLPSCDPSVGQPAPCCSGDLALNKFYVNTPTSLWNTQGNGQGGPGFSNCTDNALYKQALLSQYYTYLSKNNTFIKK